MYVLQQSFQNTLHADKLINILGENDSMGHAFLNITDNLLPR
jgi:hypothetical protein